MSEITLPQIILGAVLIQRLAELWYSQRNMRRLLDAGAVEHGAAHYPYIVILHAAWLVALIFLTPAHAPVNLAWLAVFVLFQLGRFWVLASLGRYWTTRIITVPGERLVRSGPYRFVSHPNYVVVVGELAVLPLVFGHWGLALVFSLLHAPLLYERIRTENAALAERRALD